MSHVATMKSNTAAHSLDSRILGLLALVFIALAFAFAMVPNEANIPIAESTPISPADISTQPRFSIMGENAVTVIAGFKRNCMDCHEIIDSQPRNEDLMQHKDIHMAHGLNGNCTNCHDPKDRDKLVLRDGKNVDFSQSPMLCAQCHGTTYRQWERGVHGKTLGYWDSSKGAPRKLKCVECHDPHSPRYQPMSPLPAPNTLRMGEKAPSGHHSESHDPSPLSRGYRLHRNGNNSH